MAENSNTSSINPNDTSIRKSRDQISKDHWSATCNYCNKFWYKGSPAALEDHL
ncbi:3217_t:CDS:2, partial [Gigaspora margarita]